MLYWILGLIVVGGVLLFALAQNKTAAQPSLPEVPEPFRAYKNLQNGQADEGDRFYQIIGPENSDYITPKYYHPADSSLIMMSNNYSGIHKNGKPWMDTYVKIDHKGNVIDSLSRPYTEYRERFGHLLAPEHYSSWCMDGDVSEKPYNDLSLDAAKTDREMLGNFTDHYVKAEIVTYRKDFDRDSKTWIHRAFLFKDGEWSLISQGDRLDFEKLFQQFPPKPSHEKTELLQLGAKTVRWSENTETLKLMHFQKQRHHKERSNGVFNPNNATISAHWTGETFFNLTIGQDTIPFSLQIRQEENAPKRLLLANRGYLTLFQHPKLDFALIGLKEGTWYCVRPR
ncbi:hypothetical protein [Maribacter sp. 2-571]|uniref:hypothetical protein n=1 Tax=Maribacter sp. 2-571 TaxID=3417569 RepID=UPI003D33A95B